jgi:hypothetical protein
LTGRGFTGIHIQEKKILYRIPGSVAAPRNRSANGGRKLNAEALRTKEDH